MGALFVATPIVEMDGLGQGRHPGGADGVPWATAERPGNVVDSPASCRGFEDEALGACVDLVCWGVAGLAARTGWLQAVTAASFNTSGRTDAGPGNKSFFYSALRHRQNAVFGPFGLGAVNGDAFDVADFPWALPEPWFRQLYPDVMASKGRTFQRSPQWSDVQAVGAAIGFSGPASGLIKDLQELPDQVCPRFCGIRHSGMGNTGARCCRLDRSPDIVMGRDGAQQGD